MSQYHTFTASDAVAYAQQFGGIENPSELVSAQEVGDGNLNLVFKIFDTEGVSRIIVKQALPYVRCVGESWPLTLDRARLEAQTLVAHYQHCPQHTVQIVHFDPELAVMVMEDLSDHRIWRGELINNVYYPRAAGQLGEYLAQALFHTSDFYLHPHEKKAQVAQFINPEMCEITEDLFFEWRGFHRADAPDLWPAGLRDEMEQVMRRVYTEVNNGVYRCGFAGSQDAYDAAYARLWTALDWLEDRLTGRRYLMGDAITEADVRLFTTLVRFDPVYHGHFKCNRNKLTELPALWGYARDLYQTPGFGDTVDFVQIKQHYYLVHRDLNPHGIVPDGPDLSGWLTPHGREALGGRPFGDGTPPGPVRPGEEVPNPLV